MNNFKENQKLRKMQYIPDQQGIMNRYIREKANWDIHFKNSKDFILKSAKTKQKGKAVILGSGWLLDLPLEELANQFSEIVLIDIYHPKQILHKIKKYVNVYATKADITGGLVDYFYEKISIDKKKKEKSLIDINTSYSYKIPTDVDFVVSLNIMCQLHIILVDYIKKFNLYSEKELIKLDTQIQQSHLDILPKGKSCIITDIEEEIYDSHDNLIGINPLINIELPEGNFNRKWQWKFDSLMTYREDAKTYFNDIAIDF